MLIWTIYNRVETNLAVEHFQNSLSTLLLTTNPHVKKYLPRMFHIHKEILYSTKLLCRFSLMYTKARKNSYSGWLNLYVKPTGSQSNERMHPPHELTEPIRQMAYFARFKSSEQKMESFPDMRLEEVCRSEERTSKIYKSYVFLLFISFVFCIQIDYRNVICYCNVNMYVARWSDNWLKNLVVVYTKQRIIQTNWFALNKNM